MRQYSIFFLLMLLAILPLKAQTFTPLHNFAGGASDGSNPIYDKILIVNNTIFGCTGNGGSSDYGVAYKMNINGTGFTILHSFTAAGSEGAYPYGNLLLIGNKLYGITYQGGSSSFGTIFSIDTNGNNFTTLHSFNDLRNPNNGLVQFGTRLYGICSSGGSGNGGIYYWDTNDNSYHVIKNFSNLQGSLSLSRLILINNMLYGMAAYGGSSANGTIFKTDSSGANFSVIYNFAGGVSSGANPYGSLTIINDKLYGTTTSGGASNNGVIFRIDTSGSSFEILYSFNSSGDIHNPYDLTFTNGLLFGGSPSGGSNSSGGIYQIDTNGTNYSVLYNFGSGGNGLIGSVVYYNGLLYGTTYQNGIYGKGSIFSFGMPPSVTTSTVSSIGLNSANGNANITFIGTDSVTTRGFCWNTTGTPTTSDSVVSQSGTYGTGIFLLSMSGLTPETMYHVRAFATNSVGTSYGNEVTFTTIPLPAWALAIFAMATISIGIFVIYKKFYA